MVATQFWSGGIVSVKNTFINLAPEDEQDTECDMLQARRRRDAQSCPYYISSSPEPKLEEIAAPSPAAGFQDFRGNGQPQKPHMAPLDHSELAATALPKTSWEAWRDVAAWASSAPWADTTDALEEALDTFSEVSAAHKRTTTHELSLLHSLLRDDTPRGLPLTATHSREKSVTECLDFMLGAPTPHHTCGGTLQAQSCDFFPEKLAPVTEALAPLLKHSHSSHTDAITADAPPSCQQQCASSEVCATTASKGPPSVSKLARGRGTQRRGRASAEKNRLWCHIHLHTSMLEPGFDLVKKIIGKGGCNTRKIFDATDTKVRVRGKGSGHKEPSGQEASVPLMIALAAEHRRAEDFRLAFQMTKDLLKDVSRRFQGLSRQRKSKRGPQTVPLFWVGDISPESEKLLGEMLDGLLHEAVPFTPGC